MFTKRVTRNQMIPAWYGASWEEYDTRSWICHPMPFNILMGILHRLKVMIKTDWGTVYASPREAYLQGYEDGKKEMK